MAKAKAPTPKPPRAATRRLLGFAGLSFAAAAYVGWTTCGTRAPFYRHWDAELRAALPFLGSIIFMLGSFLCEAISVRFISAVMGLQWHMLVPLGISAMIELLVAAYSLGD